MKIKTLKYLSLVFLLTASFSLHAEDKKTENEAPQTVVSSKYILNQYDLNRFVISGAITTGSEYDRLFGGQISADYRLSKRISVGGQGDFYFSSSYLNGNREYALALRSNYHVLKIEKFRKDPWDVYLGLSIGTKVYPAAVEFYNVFLGVYVGARYNLDEKWKVFSEIGTRNAALGLAVSF
ncbi:hypothetical protein ACXR6G_11045 [Ancylomarina sp. YFZ004]